MIFDCDQTTELVSDWLTFRDPEILEEIVKNSRSLAEVIVSKYPSDYREDLIQECLSRIPYAIQHYDRKTAKLHKYMTSVFYNRCNTYVSREGKQLRLCKDIESIYDMAVVDTYDTTEELLRDLTTRNKERFPTISGEKIHEITCFIYDCMIQGVRGKSRGAISAMMRKFSLRRNVATVIYHSTLAYLRMKYITFADISCNGDQKEFTLLPELEEMLGEEDFQTLSTVFGGMYIKLP